MSSSVNLILASVAIATTAGIAAPLLMGRSPEQEAAEGFRSDLVKWAAQVRADLARADSELHWVTRDMRAAWQVNRPKGEVPAAARRKLTHDEAQALSLFESDLEAMARAANERVLRRSVSERKGFFRQVANHSLSNEQTHAVVAMDNRVNVVAPAGAGKTTLLVTRAAWAVKYAGIAPEKVLLLAFDQAAAEQLRTTVDERFAAAGITSGRARVATFGELAQDVVEKATGRRPRLAEWLDHGADLDVVGGIVSELREDTPEFREHWDTYRLLFARPTTCDPEAAPDEDEQQTSEYTTLTGLMTKSRGERVIADWLLLSGVEHHHGHRYEHDVETAFNDHYRPDFHYPELDVWHEHAAPESDANPLHDVLGQSEPIDWKRAVHEHFGTTLIETTDKEVLAGWGIKRLQERLESLGLTPEWNPDRIGEHTQLRRDDLVRLVRTFMTQVKAIGHTRETLDGAWRRMGRSYRTRLFLDLYWPIHDAWQARLRADGVIDSEDLLSTATGLLESGTDPGFEMVLLDELQDTSPTRARIVRALVAPEHRHLLAVGDDWQSVNRYAGADISVMTDFEHWFGGFEGITLPTTFRCTQAVTDTAAEFVQRNPRQLRRTVRAAQPRPGEPVSLIRMADEAEIPRAISAYLADLAGKVTSASVDVLGRYGFEEKLLPEDVPSNLTVTFRTVHDAKGREADHVLIPRMVTGTYGFPSEIPADPVLDLVMSDAEAFRHAEERRLLHVAMTRARQTVTLVTVEGKESPFVTELSKSARLAVSELSTAEPLVACPACGQGSLLRRSGSFGPFLGCSTAPRCKHTQKVETLKVAAD